MEAQSSKILAIQEKQVEREELRRDSPASAKTRCAAVIDGVDQNANSQPT